MSTQCASTLDSCNCVECVKFRKEVKATYGRYLRNKPELRHRAQQGALTYTPLENGRLRFERWKYVDGMFVSVALPHAHQLQAQAWLKDIITSSKNTAVSM